MIETPAPAGRSSQDSQSSRQLVARIAAGDRAAFRRLYTTFSKPVLQSAMLALPQPRHAQAVTRATFLEVWHLAGHQANQPPVRLRAWITAVTTRRTSERIRTLENPHMLLDDYDRHVRCELAVLLSPAQPAYRTGPNPLSRSTTRGRSSCRRRLPRRLIEPHHHAIQALHRDEILGRSTT